MKARSPGFTLVELLVVSGIIAILASLSLTVLSKTKASARRVECLSRQMQWAAAFKSYAEEHDDWIPREGYHDLGEVIINNWSQVQGRPLPEGGRDSDNIWYNALPPYLSQPSARDYVPPPQRRDFYSRANLLHCPSARFPERAYWLNHQFALFSLAMNSQLIAYGRGPTIKFAQIEQHDTSGTVLFLENRLEGEAPVHPAQETTMLGQPAAFANRFSPRHGKGGNLAFADGHVQWFPGYKVVQTDDSDPLVGGPILPPQGIVWDPQP